MTFERFESLLASGKPIVADGGMGTMLFNLGLVQGSAPEIWNVEQPDKVRQVHRSYIQAGAQIVLTNTFGGNRLTLERHGVGSRTAELNAAGARLARLEADAGQEAGATDHPVVVAGSMGPTGQFFEPLGPLTPEAAAEVFAEQARALLTGGVDVLWIETMSDLNEIQAAVSGARRANSDVPVVATMTFDTRGRTMMGVTPEKAAETLAGLGVRALGANCGNGPQEIEAVISKMHTVRPQVALVAKSNAGLPHIEQGVTCYDATPDDMAAYARQVLTNGARIVGACCGSTPAHIQAIAGVIKERA
ncbi:MAG TPA: homocysteine S-methyltransferase family protein [Aggregatilineales bacterium]|nr:homocysteine S-methyltransferase family protein [Aggregatilineales bacterium]